jgi:N-acetylmuramic acid 6-phosphate etherase
LNSLPTLRATERRNQLSQDIDAMSAEELVKLFVTEDAKVPLAVEAAAPAIARVLSAIEMSFLAGGRLFYVGAGTSGRLGVLDASECPPTFGTPPEMVQGIIAGGEPALTRSIEGAEDSAATGAADLTARHPEKRDTVIGIAASGNTPYVRGALEAAKSRGATTALLACSPPSDEVAQWCDLLIVIDVGPELVTGSTRLKAGTATKLVLNMLTTGAMVRIGKTYSNLMVDLQARNAKLRDRGERIVVKVLGTDRQSARTAIDAAGGSVRTAIVMLHLGVTANEAESRLKVAGYRLRAIIGSPPSGEVSG